MRLALVAVLTATLLSVLARFIRIGRPVALDGLSGTITPEKISAYLTVIFGAAMAIAGAYFFFMGRGDADVAAILVACLGIAIAGFMAPSLTHIHDVRWTANFIEGPSKLFGPTLGTVRTTITWPDIMRTGATFTGYWYVESHDRRRVYWSYLYKGNEALAIVIQMKCKGLKVPSR